MTVLQICEWLEATSLSVLIRESQYGFPIVVAIHILGLTLSVGTLVWFDLRLLGVSMRQCRVSDVYRRLAPWLLTGFAIMFISGAVLLAAFATSAYGNLYFRIKAAALVLAGVNALIYHFTTERAIARWDEAARPPLRARLAGLSSIVVWAIVILAGRMMSYTMF
ncbi:MAG TPA: DUF6644 family protein [Vicinamibacterales bacterium]|nr:DUF6644 family protein [Vicinamibacterales bacterium]